MEKPDLLPVKLAMDMLPSFTYDVIKGISKKFMSCLKKKDMDEPIATKPIFEQAASVRTMREPTRLRVVLDLLNMGITISEIAEACGIEFEDLVEGYISGEVAAPLSFKKRFCEIYNVNPKWLIHGKEAPFSHFQNRKFHEAHDSASFISDYQPDGIYFVKVKSDEAPFCIVLKETMTIPSFITMVIG